MSLSFLKHWLGDPASVGAVAPSSRYLADAMASDVPHYDAIVELGAGTGAITRSLVRRHPNARLVLFELSDSLAQRLRKEYPHAEVISGVFHENAEVLKSLPPRTIFVSGLPFRSLPGRVITPTVSVLESALKVDPCRKLVQFTYQPRVPFDPPKGFGWRRQKTIWRNAPPASVWHLTAR